MSQRYDVIVLGVGGMGSAALCHLARRGRRCLGLEQFDIPHDRGSSHGITRIIRLAYYEHPSYVPLLRRAYELWRELEAQSGMRLLHITGSVDAGPPGGGIFEGALLSCQVHGLPHEVLTSRELTARFPAYRLPAETQVLFQPDGGFLLPEACISAHVMLAQEHGAGVRAASRSPRNAGNTKPIVSSFRRARGSPASFQLSAAGPSPSGRYSPGWRPAAPNGSGTAPSPSSTCWSRKAATTDSRSSVSRASSSGAIITAGSRWIPIRITAGSNPKTRAFCAVSPSATSPRAPGQHSLSTPACSPIRRTSTSSSTCSPAILRSWWPRPARATASSSPA